MQGRALDGRGQRGDARGALHGRQHLGTVRLRRQNQRVRLEDLRLLDQDLMERRSFHWFPIMIFHNTDNITIRNFHVIGQKEAGRRKTYFTCH